ncbi:MAG: adenylyl-sulfate kinase [Terriglobia bacterium]
MEKPGQSLPADTRGVTLWFTGLPCSGKSTVSRRVYDQLRAAGVKVELLDGDIVRRHLTKGLGFSKEDRDENIRRIGFVCRLLTRNGVVAIAAAISPYRSVREEVRRLVGSFVEIYVDCPLEVCIQRDVKGMYKKALAGELPQFTGISDPYEPPLLPEVTLATHQETPEESAAKVLRRLSDIGYLPRARAIPESYPPEEEEAIRRRLEQLGYL